MRKIVSAANFSLLFAGFTWLFFYMAFIAAFGDPHPSEIHRVMPWKVFFAKLFLGCSVGSLIASVTLALRTWRNAKARAFAALAICCTYVGQWIYTFVLG
jgi:hypothetical protein